MYEKGQGVILDYEEAFKWYQKAAVNGYAKAQSNLGFLYMHGHGVLKSYENAYAWWEVATANGNIEARKNLEIVQKRIPKNKREKGKQLAIEIRASLNN